MKIKEISMKKKLLIVNGQLENFKGKQKHHYLKDYYYQMEKQIKKKFYNQQKKDKY